ncbi:unnamed protein product [Lactuca saligna]|uniref:Uncharacterized protein n=2 Tax=Lactuca saligna TaxID=75948 RepID=A0AA36EEB5_LACSI|nr:unnamed protein product [Lactuca saligna]
MEFNSGGSGGARSGGNDVQLLSKMLQVEHKLFYFDLKENLRGRYMNISEKTSASRPSSNYNNRMQQAIGPQKVGPSMEWKVKPIAHSQRSIKEDELEKKLKESHISDDKHVIIPNHLHVPEAEKLGFCFGSFDATFSFNKTPSNSYGLVAMTVSEQTSEASEEADETIEDQMQSRNENADGEEDHLERPTTSSYVPKNLPTEATIHQFLRNETFPQQPQQGAGGMYPAPPPPVTAASNSKYPLPQYKPGSNTWSIGMAGSYGPYASAASAGYNSASAAASSMESFRS